MKSNQDDQMERAAAYWREGQALEAGKVIFENLSGRMRPGWASRILRLVIQRSGLQSPLFDEVLYTADHVEEWGKAHQVFSTLRDSYLELLRLKEKQGLTEDQELLAGLVALAELVAKVTYNATDPPDEFDEDSGWYIAWYLKGFIDAYWSDAKFSEAAWSALSGEEA